MFIVLALLFIALPIAEIALLLKVGSGLGFVATVAFVIFTAVLGAYLVREQGVSTLTKVREETEAGRMPATEMAEGVLLLIAGAVLLTPGFITDAMGFSLLVPAVRRAVIRWVAANSLKASNGAQAGFVFTTTRSSSHSSNQTRKSFGASTKKGNSASKPKDKVIIEGSYRESD